MANIPYLTDPTGQNCFFLDCQLEKKLLKVTFAFWVPKLRGEILLRNRQGDRVLMVVPEFVWDMEHHDCLYKAEYQIIEVIYGNERRSG